MSSPIRQLCCILMLLNAMHVNLNAQAPYFRNIVFDKEKKEAKLLKIFQDKKGYMWLGTNFGICRYDGINFKYLEKDSNQVTAITENSDGILWLGHENGAIEYVENNTAIKFLPNNDLAKIKITDIVFDNQNRLWFSTFGKGIYYFDKNTLYNINEAGGLTDNKVYSLLILDDKIWAATDKGISICSFKNGQKEITAIDCKNGLPNSTVRSLKKDAAGNVWIGLQEKGVCIFDKKSGQINIPDELCDWQFGQVNDLLPLKREVFIGTEEHGIIEIHFGLPKLNVMIPSKKKKINAVNQLLQDKNEQVWMVADNLLSLTNSTHFQLVEIPPEWQDSIKAITTDITGRIWYLNNKGLFVKKDNNSLIQKIKLPQHIDFTRAMSLYADEEMNIWIGTYNNGLYQYVMNENKIKHYTQKNGLVDNTIVSITGNNGDIWLGTLGGVSKLILLSGSPLFENFSTKNGLSNNIIYNVFIDSKERKWFATAGSGITKFDEFGFQHYDSIPGLYKNIVYAITEDIYGNIWFIGKNSGLFSFNGKTFKRYGIRDGLQDNDILNIVPDNKGNLLLAHPDGVEIFNIKKEYFTFYGVESGFDNINPQLNAFSNTKNGGILIGATDKIIQYYPTDAAVAPFPKIVMNSVSIFLNPINFSKKYKFNYDENHLTFDYAGLWYLDPGAINYQYQLEGYSKDWINTRDHIQTFPNLPPGKYTFKVKTSINDDFRYAPTLTYFFTINKPFWKTLWFLVLSTLSAGWIIAYFVGIRIKLIRYQQEKEKQNLITQLELLKNQLNPHFLFNSLNTLMNIIDKDKSLAIEFTEKLADFYRDILMIQDKEMITVEEELNLLKNYIYLQQKRFSNNVKLSLHIFE